MDLFETVFQFGHFDRGALLGVEQTRSLGNQFLNQAAHEQASQVRDEPFPHVLRASARKRHDLARRSRYGGRQKRARGLPSGQPP